MGEVHVQSHLLQEQPLPLTPKQQQQHTELLQLRDSVEPIELFSTLHLNNNAAAGGTICCHNQPCAAATARSLGSNSMKRRSPETSTAARPRSAKKLFYDQEDLTLHGFSAVQLPVSLGSLAGKDAAGSGGDQPCRPLQRTVSEPCKSPVGELQECVTGGGGNPVMAPPRGRGQGLPPLPPASLRRTVSSPAKALSPDSSVRLRRIKDRLKEMKQWFDVTMKDAEEDEDEDEEKGKEKEEEQQQQQQKEELSECAVVAEDDQVPPQDELEGGEAEAEAEEAISVELADKCLNLTFWCPCGKGYEVLLSANKCYYKLV